MEANPAVNSVEWKIDDTILKNSSFEYTIKDVNASHNGNYSCRVGNAIGFSNFSNIIVLSVNYSAFCKSIVLLPLLQFE